jgi:GH24 family phage-related lysozyme (muramidase)
MTEEEKKKRILSLSAYQPDSITKYRTAQVAAPDDFDYDEYQRRMNMIQRGQNIQNLGLYEQEGIENTGAPYYQVGKRETQLTPEAFASFAQKEGFDPEDYYSSLEWMQENVNPLTKGLNDFDIGLAGSKEGLKTPLREQFLGPQHASTKYGSFEYSPDEIKVDRSGRRVFPQRTLQTKANPRAGKEATYLETQGTLTYPAWEKAYNAGLVTTPWEEGVVDQKGLVTGDPELYNANAQEEIKGTTNLDKKIPSSVEWQDKVLFDQEPYPKMNAYGGDMNYYGTGGVFEKIGAGLYGAAEGVLDTATFGLTDNLTDKVKFSSPEAEAIRAGTNVVGNVAGAVINPAATGTAVGQSGDNLKDLANTGVIKNDGVNKALNVVGTGAEVGSMFMGDVGAGSEIGGFAQTLQDVGQSKVAGQIVGQVGNMANTSFGAYGGNIYATGGFMQPTIDPEHRKQYKKDLKFQENDAKVGMTTLDKWTDEFPDAEKWMPYTAVEDKGKKNPTYDIGYGNKLGRKKDGKLMVTIGGKEVDAMKGLNSDQIDTLLDESITAHENIARKQWNKNFPNNKYDDLPQAKQVLITDFAYNLGDINKFPSLMDALNENDEKKAYDEYERFSGGKPLVKRNTWSAKQLDKIFVEPKLKAKKAKATPVPVPTPAQAESTNINNRTLDLVEKSRANRKAVQEYLNKNKKAYGGDLDYYSGDMQPMQPMPTMTPGQIPINTPGIQSHVNYDPEVLQGRMERLYNPNGNNRSIHLNQDTGERRNTNFLGDLFTNTRRTSVEGGQYANGGNIDNLYQAGGNLTEYNGNTHEVGGIPLGNTNNEVEDGEIRWDTPDGESYIFSNRIPYTKSKKK